MLLAEIGAAGGTSVGGGVHVWMGFAGNFVAMKTSAAVSSVSAEEVKSVDFGMQAARSRLVEKRALIKEGVSLFISLSSSLYQAEVIFWANQNETAMSAIVKTALFIGYAPSARIACASRWRDDRSGPRKCHALPFSVRALHAIPARLQHGPRSQGIGGG